MLATLLGAEVFQPFLVFVRIGAIVSLMPGFSAAYVSVRVRLMLALAIAVMLTPVLADTLPPPPSSVAGLGLLVLGETVVGVFIGCIGRILLAALHAAGTMAAYYSSLANAIAQDPVSDQQSSTMAGFFATFGMVMLFVTDLHHLLLRAMLDSYELFPAGGLPPVADLAQAMGRLLADSFLVALQLTAPFLVIGIGYQVGVGLLSRLMPQLPVFFFGLPVQIGLQLWVTMLTISGIMIVFLNYFAESFSATLLS
jgi:flagellar biosynthetic protein FliR